VSKSQEELLKGQDSIAKDSSPLVTLEDELSLSVKESSVSSAELGDQVAGEAIDIVSMRKVLRR